MIKVGVADYGLNYWYGALYDYRDRFALIKEAGYDGIERLEVSTAEEALNISAEARKEGVAFATCRSSNGPMQTLRFTSGLGLEYVWVDARATVSKTTMEQLCCRANHQVECAKKFGVKVAVHNHLGDFTEKEEWLDEFMQRCPGCYLVFDVGHMSGAGGDVMRVLEKYYDRLAAVHMKDYVIVNPDTEKWQERIRFCELGAGVMGDLNHEVLRTLKKKGYDNKWIFVEHDSHLHDPLIDLKISREFIRKDGI